MAALVKELMIDIARDRTDVITSIDLSSALARLLTTEQVTRHHAQAMLWYIQGYTLTEIKDVYPNARELLTTTFALLEAESQYSDDAFLVRNLRKYPKKQKIAASLTRAMLERSRNFNDDVFFDLENADRHTAEMDVREALEQHYTRLRTI